MNEPTCRTKTPKDLVEDLISAERDLQRIDGRITELVEQKKRLSDNLPDLRKSAISAFFLEGEKGTKCFVLGGNVIHVNQTSGGSNIQITPAEVLK